ncbi:MAG: hypothetical protein QOI02_1523 [Actinomycetota bacterium]|nr:hypothetical protein [Actinomycetota bacterium]
MARDEEEDPLSWVGTNDFTHTESKVKPPKERKLRDAAGAVIPATVVSSALLITFGILAGAYLLFTVGWIIALSRDPFTPAGVLESLMYQLRHLLSVIAPAAWYTTVLVLTRQRRPTVRLLWLLIGVVTLIPWPFVVGV